VLGYEPTSVQSRLFIADAYCAARDAMKLVNVFLSKYNPMFPPGEAKLLPHVLELMFPHDVGAIVIINNSLFPDDEFPFTYGLLHKGEIVQPNPSAKRVINSMGLTPELVPSADLARFLDRHDLD
jgi:hypothetical protein